MTPIAPDCPGLVKLMCSFYVLLVYYHLTQVFSLTSNSLKSFETWPPFFDLLPSLRKWLKCLLLTFFGNLLHQFSWFSKASSVIPCPFVSFLSTEWFKPLLLQRRKTSSGFSSFSNYTLFFLFSFNIKVLWKLVHTSNSIWLPSTHCFTSCNLAFSPITFLKMFPQRSSLNSRHHQTNLQPWISGEIWSSSYILCEIFSRLLFGL